MVSEQFTVLLNAFEEFWKVLLLATSPQAFLHPGILSTAVAHINTGNIQG